MTWKWLCHTYSHLLTTSTSFPGPIGRVPTAHHPDRCTLNFARTADRDVTMLRCILDACVKRSPATCRRGLLAPFSTNTGKLSNSQYNRPSPPPLSQKDQKEFEELVRKAQTPLASALSAEADLALHPDALRPLAPEFEGDVNPLTGEQGGPKREPVHRWREDEGDWSYKGKVSDF
jgi:hypothetical protein